MSNDPDALWQKYIAPRADPETFSRDRRSAAIEVIRKAHKKAQAGRRDLHAVREAIVAWQLLTADTMAWVVSALQDASDGEQAEIRRFLLWSKAGFSRLDHLPEVRALLLPAALHEALTEAFGALGAGEVLDLLKPAQPGRHGPVFRWDKARLRAVEYVHFFKASGVTKAEAREEVGAAIGNIAVETLRVWERDFQTESAPFEFELASEAGRLHAVLGAGGTSAGFDENVIHKHRELTNPGLVAFGEIFQREFGARTQGVKPRR